MSLLTLLVTALLLSASGEPSGDLASSHRSGFPSSSPHALAPAPATTVPGDPTQLLVEIRVGRILRWTELVWEREGEVFLPLVSFLERVEVEVREEPEGAVSGVLHPAHVEFRLDPGAPGTLIREGVLFLSTSALARLLDLPLEVDRTDLAVRVRNPESLPVVRRLAREERRRVLEEGRRTPEPARPYASPVPSVGGFAADWSVFTPLDSWVEGSSLEGALGLRVFGGSLRLSSRSRGPASEGSFRSAATFQRAWADGRILRQLHLGHAFGSGPRPRTITGLHLTNVPHVRAREMGMASMGGRLGPGWEVELRQQGQVLDVSRADEQGAFALDVPLSYGENAIQVVAFGPHGEVLTSEHIFLRSRERLPGGALEWGMSGGLCDLPSCRNTGNLDLRWGASRRWTLRGGVDGFVRDSLPHLLHPYASLVGSPVGPLEVSGEWVGGAFLRGSASYTPSPRFRGRVAHTRFDGSQPFPILHAPGRRSTVEADLLWYPSVRRERWTVQGSVVQEAGELLERVRWQLRSGAQWGRLRVETGVRGEDLGGSEGAPDHRIHPGIALTGTLPLGSRFRPWLRTEVEGLGISELYGAQVRGGIQATRRSRLEGSIRWNSSLGTRITLGMTAEMSSLRSLTQLFTSSDGESRMVQLTQGTLRWDETSGRLSTGPGPGMERGGISGTVFVDRNGNGRHDPEEPVLEGVQVRIGGRVVRTDERGRFESWDLTPFQFVRVSVDPVDLPDPRWTPRESVVEVAVLPSSYRRVEVPVVPAAEISGRVVLLDSQGRLMAPAGVELELVDERSGAVRELRTFSDGGFYLMGVPPGSYRLQVPPQLRARLDLDASVASLPVHVDPVAEGQVLSGLLLRLVPVER